MVVPGSEINSMAIGADGVTFYVADTPNRKLYKSTDGGTTWTDISPRLFSAVGGAVHIWDVSLAPDDVNFVAVVTDVAVLEEGPKRVFISDDGGQNWDAADSGLMLAGDEFIGCIDVSVKYGQYRDIAIGTRSGSANGKVWVLKVGVITPGWQDQGLAASAGDVMEVKFSPSYVSDSGLVAVTARGGAPNTRGTYLHLGKRDTVAGTTTWNTAAGYSNYPVRVDRTVGVGQVITVDLELPSDFLATAPPPVSPQRRYYISINATGNVGYLYRVDDTRVRDITPPISPPGGIFSIAYHGDYSDGNLLVGEVLPYATGRVRVWRSSNPTYRYPQWRASQPDYGSPTGGFGTGRANAILVWHPDGARAYCGTSSATLTSGGTNISVSNMWPGALLTAAPVGDESAFSVSPCSVQYEMGLNLAGKEISWNVGERWVQVSLVDSNIQRLCDVAALNVPDLEGGTEVTFDYDIQYLSSLSSAAGGYSYSIWRSIGDLPGASWERVMWLESHNGDRGVILRVRQPDYEENYRSKVIAYAEVGWRDVGYSSDEGQSWEVIPGELDVDIVDLAVGQGEYGERVYALSSSAVYRYVREGGVWQVTKVYTDFPYNHTIAVPLKNPEGEEWVVVGEEGPPDGRGRVAYADLSQTVIKFLPSVDERRAVPIEGNVHVITDDQFDENRTIYAASHDPLTPSTTGKIYRWVIGKSKDWEELGPPNSAFYGLAMRKDVLYGAWAKAESTEILTGTGVDRTLFSRAPVPPPPEWDYLITGLPKTGLVTFTCEPSSLKISGGKYNMLWAIDNRNYDWPNQQGCLWVYTDIFARVGPWTILPASGDVLPCDPVSGLAKQVDFRWRQLDYASIYELQIAKDKEFTIRVLVKEDIMPEDQESPAVFFPSGGLVVVPASEISLPGTLECGHEYYWRVRVRGAATGEEVYSPWSAVMHFVTKVGVPVSSKYASPVLLKPNSGATEVVLSPTFTWAPLPGVTRYEFVLARDSDLKQVLVKTKVSTNAFKYEGELSPGAKYFWQVKAVEPVIGEPSAVASFRTVEAKSQAPARPREPVGVLTWAGIAVYTILAAVVMVFIRARLSQQRGAEETEEE